MGKIINVLFKNKDGKLVWWKILIDVIAILFILGSIGIALNPTYTATTTYTTEAIEAKEAVYSEPTVYTYDIGEIVVCGEDIPVATYTVETKGTNQFGDSTIVEYQQKGQGEFEGQNLSTKEQFECEEGYQVRTYNDIGTFTLTTEPELISEATEAIPAEEVTEVLEYDSWLEEWSATSNDEVVNPEELTKYDELKSDIDSQMAE